MKRIALLLVLCLLTLVGTTWADTPAFIDESAYPTYSKPLTPAEQAHLGLTPKFLKEPLEVLNRVGPSNYKFCRLEPGDVVLVDKDGTPRYKASCGNRIETLPVKVTVIAPPPVAPIVATPPVVASGTNWGEFFKTLGALLLTALLITAALVLIIWALRGAFQRRTTPPTPEPVPTPRVVPLVPPTPEPTPAPAVTPTPAPEEPLIVPPTAERPRRRPTVVLEVRVTVPRQ